MKKSIFDLTKEERKKIYKELKKSTCFKNNLLNYISNLIFLGIAAIFPILVALQAGEGFFSDGIVNEELKELCLYNFSLFEIISMVIAFVGSIILSQIYFSRREQLFEKYYMEKYNEDK